MSRPADIPTWSTDENIDDPGSTWDGTPTKVAPGSGMQADGFVPDKDVGAQHLNWLLNLVGGWIEYFGSIIDSNDEHTYPMPKSRARLIPMSVGQPHTELEEWVFVRSAPQPARWRSERDNAEIEFPLSPFLPTGAVITAIEVAVEAPGGGANVVLVRVDGHDFVNGGPADDANVASATGGGGLGGEDITLSGLSEAVENTLREHVVRVIANGSGGTDKNSIYWLRVTFDDPGPRNF